MELITSWVKPPNAIGGFDHLAVQAPCISLYGKMLPGITNVTDRARYTISPEARKEVLKHLLALNHLRAEEEKAKAPVKAVNAGKRGRKKKVDEEPGLFG